MAQNVVKRLKRSVWRLKGLTLEGKMRSFKSMVLPVLLHGCETWTLNGSAIAKMEGFMGRTLRTLLGLGWSDKISFEEVRHRTGMCGQQGPIAWHLRYRQLRWFGHVLRMDANRWPLQILCGRPPDSRRPQCRPPRRWIDSVYEYLEELGIQTSDYEGLRELAMNRAKWKEIIKTPMRCGCCVARDQARAQVHGVIIDIIDRIDPPPPPIKDSVAEKNPEATWTSRDQPWFFNKTAAGPIYGVSRYGRVMKRSREYNGPGRKCPNCLQYWPITMDSRSDNVPIKKGECGVCGQQLPQPQINKRGRMK